MVLLQKGLHLLNKILCVDLGSLVLISETLHFFVKKLLDGLKVNMEALFIGLNLNLKEAFICLLTVNVLSEAIVNVDDLPLNLLSWVN